MVTKMPAKRIATSRMGAQEKSFSLRTSVGVRRSDSSPSPR